MFYDFIYRAIFAAIGLSIISGPFGCLLVWRRMSYFGDTMAHSAILGVVLALLLDLNLNLAIFIIATCSAFLLILLQKGNNVSNDTALGIIAHFTLALGLAALGFMPWIQIDIMAYLFGDILAVSNQDLYLIWGGGIVALLILSRIWKTLLLDTLSPDIVKAEQKNGVKAKFTLMLLLAFLIAIAMKVIGVLLFTALLIIPAATARYISKTPEQMAIFAALISLAASLSGLLISLRFDPPTAPTIVVTASLIFFITAIINNVANKNKLRQ